MPAEGISMHKIKDILRLSFEAGLSQHQIAASLQLSSGVVNKYLTLARAAHISWPLPEEIDELKLRELLRPHTKKINRFAELDYASIHQELKCKGVTLLLLWQEYEQTQGKYAYRYAQYCAKYKEWLGKQKPSMRQVHRAGEKLFIDYCGPTIDILDPETGEIVPAQIFVATLGASNYTYAEATLNQRLPNWIASHVRAFQFFGGVPALLVPDNLRAAVSKACRYDPQINNTYADMAAFYGTAVLPTRPYKPKDKAKVENAVLVIQRWVLAKLRHQTFVGLAELNKAISLLLKELNQKPFKKLPGSRQSQFEALDKNVLKPLPARPYEFAEFKKVRVHIDYHIEVDKHYYSVPHALVKQEVTVRLTATTVECLYQGQRVASHTRNYRKGSHTTLPEHMPVAHQKHLNWTPGRFLNWALEIGPGTRDLVQHLLNHKAHPEQSYRTCLGLLALAKRYSAVRLEAACLRALAIGAPTRRSVASILEKGLERQPLPEKIISSQSTEKRKQHYHDNIRGSDYYQLLDESHLLN